MSQPVFALTRRELQRAVRSPRTYLVRLGLLTILFIELAGFQRAALYVGAPGLRFFSMVMWTNVILLSVVGAGYFAAAIAEEKEERTLGLLRMTALGPLAILAGKTAPRLVAVLTFVLVQVPFTVLAVTLGGVAMNQVLAAYAALLAYTVLLAGLGLFLSVLARRTGDAAALTLLVLLAFFLGPPIGKALVAELARSGWPPAVLCRAPATQLLGLIGRAGVFDAIAKIMRTGFTGPILGFQVLTNLGLGVFGFALARLSFERFTREEKEPAPLRTLVPHLLRRRRLFPVPRAWRRALLWKEFYFNAGGRTAQAIKGLIILGSAVFVGRIEHRGAMPLNVQAFGGAMMGVGLWLLGFELLYYASTTFNRELRGKTLSGLALLPRSPGEIVNAKIAGCLLAALPTLGFVIIGSQFVAHDVVRALAEILGNLAGWCALAGGVFFLYVVAYLSLLLPHGAWLVGFGLFYAGSTLVFAVFALLGHVLGGGDTAQRVALATVFGALLVGSAFLHRALGRQLRNAAARG